MNDKFYKAKVSGILESTSNLAISLTDSIGFAAELVSKNEGLSSLIKELDALRKQADALHKALKDKKDSLNAEVAKTNAFF